MVYRIPKPSYFTEYKGAELKNQIGNYLRIDNKYYQIESIKEDDEAYFLTLVELVELKDWMVTNLKSQKI